MSTRTGPLSAAAYAGMFVFGIVMALLGAVLPALSDRLQFDASGIGQLFLTMNAAMLACSLLLGLAMDRFGLKPPLAAGPLLVAVALLQIASATSSAALTPATLLLGMGGGALNGATNTLIADLHDDPRRKSAALNLLGVFFGFGALLLPFTIGALMEVLSARTLLVAAAMLCSATGIYAVVLNFPPPKQRNRLRWAEMRHFLHSPLVLSMAALLFFQSGVEFTIGGFASTYLTRNLSMSVTAASYVLAGYWAALMAARIGLSRLLLNANPHHVVRGSAILAGVGALIISTAGSAATAIAGILLAGLSLAGIFPTLLGIAGARFPSHSGSVFGILFTCALTGGMTLPWVAGHLGQAYGLASVFILVVAAFAAIALLGIAVEQAG